MKKIYFTLALLSTTTYAMRDDNGNPFPHSNRYKERHQQMKAEPSSPMDVEEGPNLNNQNKTIPLSAKRPSIKEGLFRFFRNNTNVTPDELIANPDLYTGKNKDTLAFLQDLSTNTVSQEWLQKTFSNMSTVYSKTNANHALFGILRIEKERGRKIIQELLNPETPLSKRVELYKDWENNKTKKRKNNHTIATDLIRALADKTFCAQALKKLNDGRLEQTQKNIQETRKNDAFAFSSAIFGLKVLQSQSKISINDLLRNPKDEEYVGLRIGNNDLRKALKDKAFCKEVLKALETDSNYLDQYYNSASALQSLMFFQRNGRNVKALLENPSSEQAKKIPINNKDLEAALKDEAFRKQVLEKLNTDPSYLDQYYSRANALQALMIIKRDHPDLHVGEFLHTANYQGIEVKNEDLKQGLKDPKFRNKILDKLQKNPFWLDNLKKLSEGDNFSHIAHQFSDGIPVSDIEGLFSDDSEFSDEE